MKTLNSAKGASRVLKNLKLWNKGEDFVDTDIRIDAEGKLVSKEEKDFKPDQEIDCNGALVLPALFGLGLDFMEPLRDDVYVAASMAVFTKVPQTPLTMPTRWWP